LQYVQKFINITTFDTISRLNEVMTATHDKFTIPHHYTFNEEKNIRTQPRRKRQLIAALTKCSLANPVWSLRTSLKHGLGTEREVSQAKKSGY
jgi:hypothetical protein